MFIFVIQILVSDILITCCDAKKLSKKVVGKVFLFQSNQCNEMRVKLKTKEIRWS